MTIELFKGDVSGGEAGTSFPRMVLLFLSGTIITSNGHILDRHFRKKKKIKKAIANLPRTAVAGNQRRSLAVTRELFKA